MFAITKKEKEKPRKLTKEEKRVIYIFFAVIVVGTIFPMFTMFKYFNYGAITAAEAFEMGQKELFNYYIGSAVVWVICLVISLIHMFLSKPENRKIAEDYAMALFLDGICLGNIYMLSTIIFTMMAAF